MTGQEPSPRRAAPSRSRMSDVARLADVSPATVSRALRQPQMVSASVRARIAEAIERLSYRPNLMAGALASARSATVAVIIPSMINSFFAATVDALEEGLRGSGLQLMIGNSRYSPETEEQLVLSFLAWSPAAIVLTGRRHTKRTVKALLDSALPVFEMWELSDHPIDEIIGFSQSAIGAAVVRHFAERGARRLGFVGAMMDLDYRAADRRTGFVEAAVQAGFAPPAEARIDGPASASAGAAAFGRLLDGAPEVDAVFFTNDALALGGLFEAQRRGLTTPQRIKLCGFGDLDFASACEPPLTTVRPPRQQIGAKIAELLRARIAGAEAVGGSHDLGFELAVRGTT
ncbi:LacI family DNA-binding transcriptional regulator [Alsobacter sp. SYSU BS001988]